MPGYRAGDRHALCLVDLVSHFTTLEQIRSTNQQWDVGVNSAKCVDARADGMSLWLDCDRDFAPETVAWGLQQGMGESNLTLSAARTTGASLAVPLISSASFLKRPDTFAKRRYLLLDDCLKFG